MPCTQCLFAYRGAPLQAGLGFFLSVAVRSEARESTRVQSALNRSLPGWREGMYGFWACQQLLCALLW